MSDRRPSKLWKDGERVCVAINRDGDPVWLPKRVEASPADLVAEIRSRVESGTIKGEVVWRCGEGSGHEDGWFCDRAVPTDQLGPNCGFRLVIPVSDGGSET